jgi:hypothetical protein
MMGQLSEATWNLLHGQKTFDHDDEDDFLDDDQAKRCDWGACVKVWVSYSRQGSFLSGLMHPNYDSYTQDEQVPTGRFHYSIQYSFVSSQCSLSPCASSAEEAYQELYDFLYEYASAQAYSEQVDCYFEEEEKGFFNQMWCGVTREFSSPSSSGPDSGDSDGKEPIIDKR